MPPLYSPVCSSIWVIENRRHLPLERSSFDVSTFSKPAQGCHRTWTSPDWPTRLAWALRGDLSNEWATDRGDDVGVEAPSVRNNSPDRTASASISIQLSARLHANVYFALNVKENGIV